MSEPKRVDALSRPGLEVWTLPISADVTSPFAEENELAARLGKRGPHLLAGRCAAHAALRAAGISPTALPRGAEGEVVWPRAVVGAISHTPDLAVAAVGDADRFAGVGVDVERARRKLGDGTTRIVAPSEEEQAWLSGPPAHVVGDALVALTSAKEVVFKAYFPPTGVRLRFAEAVVTPTEGGFFARVLRELPVARELSIERAVLGEYVLLAAALPRD